MSLSRLVLIAALVCECLQIVAKQQWDHGKVFNSFLPFGEHNTSF